MKKILVTVFSAIIVSLVLFGCENWTSSDNFSKYDTGDRFGENRDGYMVKLNNSFFANISYKDDGYGEIYKLLDFTSSDLLGNAKIYYSGDISKCYCNDSNILIYSATNDNYILIDCSDINNTKNFTALEDADADLSDYTEITIFGKWLS